MFVDNHLGLPLWPDDGALIFLVPFVIIFNINKTLFVDMAPVVASKHSLYPMISILHFLKLIYGYY